MQQTRETNLSNNKPMLDTYGYEDKFYCTDNIRHAAEARIQKSDVTYNENYRGVIIVQQGSMNVRVNNTLLKLKTNDYLAILPYTNIEILWSRCKLISLKVSSYIMHDLYEQLGIDVGIREGFFTYKHYHLTPRQAAILTHDYEHIKQEILTDYKSMKEYMITARLGVYIAHQFSILSKLEPVSHDDNSEIGNIFNKFLTLLDQHYKQERSVQYYANELNIQPKTLSTATVRYTGKTASRVIDEYVVMRIKIVLYNNRHNIKEVSDMFNFASQSFFGRYFKRIVGCSPRKYVSTTSKKLSK